MDEMECPSCGEAVEMEAAEGEQADVQAACQGCGESWVVSEGAMGLDGDDGEAVDDLLDTL